MLPFPPFLAAGVDVFNLPAVVGDERSSSLCSPTEQSGSIVKSPSTSDEVVPWESEVSPVADVSWSEVLSLLLRAANTRIPAIPRTAAAPTTIPAIKQPFFPVFCGAGGYPPAPYGGGENCAPWGGCPGGGGGGP